MALKTNETFQKLARLLVVPTVDPSQRAARIQAVEKDIILPLRLLVLAIIGYYFFFTHWTEVTNRPRDVGHHWLARFFWLYLVANLLAGTSFIWVRHMTLRMTQWINFSVGISDAVLMSGLVFITEGFDSNFYWIFLVLMLHNALAIPLALPQILLNVLALLGYVGGGLLDQKLIVSPDSTYETRNPSGILDRVVVLVIWAGFCYGIQVLFERQRRIEAEATEMAVRQERLRTAGRLAAEIAHKIKNPLGIITNASFCLQRAAAEGQFEMDIDDRMGMIREQSGIIREEVVKADEILTELMGYSQLAEGHVERLELAAEIDDAIQQVFPSAAKYDIRVLRYYSPELPAVLMQRPHLASVLVNLLQNAREALEGRSGQIEITTRYGEQDSFIIIIADNGPGIPADRIDKIFDAYFSTRAKGTGLGLAIVKHNAEMYGGTVRAESVLGKGSRFIIEFPARTLMRLNP